MNQVTTQKAEGGLSYKNVSIAQTGGGGMLLPQTFGEVVAFATMMSRSQHAIPKHLRDNDGACMAITMQALRWEMDPFMVASKSYNVKDLIAYESQLVAAVVNTRAPIKKRPNYDYDGEGDTRRCIVSCEMNDGTIKTYESPMIGKITTKNSPLWKSDPDQQLGYFAIRSWARRHAPEVILGVYTPDEADQFSGPDNAKDVTPRQSVMERLQAARDASPEVEERREGFDHAFVHSETSDALTGEIFEQNSDLAPSGSDDAASDAPAEAGAESPQAPASPETDRAILIQYAADVLPKAADQDVTPAALAAIEKHFKAFEFEKLSPAGVEKARAISTSMRAIANDPARFDGVIEHYSDVLECSREELGG